MPRFETALITGGSTGIGRALARVLVAEGTKVAICGRRSQLLNETVEELGDAVTPFVVDVSEPDAVRRMVKDAHEALGSLDLVIANAGVGGTRPASKLEVKHILPLIQINITGALVTLTAALPYQLKRGRGYLVGISSLAGYRGLPTSAAYSASKAALSIFLESLRVDLASTPIGVIDVRPGFIKTPMTDKNAHPMPFLMDADDAARRILKAVVRRQRVYAFPWPLAWLVRLTALLPGWLYDRIIRLVTP